MVVLSENGAESPTCQPARPLQVGFYEIICTLGKGNFAVVKLARHKVTKTQVAIKIIDKTRLDATDLEKLNREVQIMKLLNHPHIIKLYQVMETKDMLYIVTEYAKNGEMFDYLASNGPLSEEEAHRTFRQILTAVEYCHKHRVVHRDLKAENLLLDDNMNIKLADFGFGNFYVPGKSLSTWCGSPPYAAPEVFEGKQYEGPQLDIWSLGVVLYVLVCGSLPFDGANLLALKQRVTEGRFRVPYFMSQDCENLIRRMLAVDPAKRISVAQIKQHRWVQADPTITCQPTADHKCPDDLLHPESYSQPVLSLMQTLGIDKQKTIESLQNNSYNHFSAIYWLLLERLTEHRSHQHIQPGQDWSKISGYAFPGPELSGEAKPNTLQYRNSVSPSIYLDTRTNEKSPTKHLKQVEDQLPLDLTTDYRNPTRRHTFSEMSSSKHTCQPPNIVVDLVDDVTSESSFRSSSSASSSSLTSPSVSFKLGTALYGHQAQGLHPVSQNSSRGHITHSSVLRCQNNLQIPDFQEGRRASDTSLTQGLRPFNHQLKKNNHIKRQLGLNKVEAPLQHSWLPIRNQQDSDVSAVLPNPPRQTHSWEHLYSPVEGIDHQRMSHLYQPSQQQLLQVPSSHPPLTASIQQQNTWPSTSPPSLGFKGLLSTSLHPPQHKGLQLNTTSHLQTPQSLLSSPQAPQPQHASYPSALTPSWCSFTSSSSSNMVDSTAMLLEAQLQISQSPQQSQLHNPALQRSGLRYCPH